MSPAMLRMSSPCTRRSRSPSRSATTVARDSPSRLEVVIGDVSVAGTTVGSTSRPRLVEVLGQSIELELAPHVGILRYADKPGKIGTVGTVIAGQGINIASMAVGRSLEGQATMGVTVDTPVPPETQAAIAEGADADVWFVELDV